MKIDDTKFDYHLHHPVYTISKLKNLELKIDNAKKIMSESYKEIEKIVQDLSLYRQELLDTIKDDSKPLSQSTD